MKLSTEDINSLIETQLANWPEAKRNFDAMTDIDRKSFALGDFNIQVQHNPARIRSTAAATDKESIAKRACFLCTQNRPKEQYAVEWIEGWDLLVNPYPILPVHFTIVSKKHTPQDEIPLEMAAMAEMAPDLAIFFNGAHAGASAPDHKHCQAVLKAELPLVQLVQKYHSPQDPDVVSSEEFNLKLPFHFVSAIIKPTPEGMLNLHRMTQITGVDDKTGAADPGLVNAFFWIDNSGLLRIVVIPRKAHRPACFFADDDSKMMISPGALDMAGLLITPRREDFDRINPIIANSIYSEVAFADTLPASKIFKC